MWTSAGEYWETNSRLKWTVIVLSAVGLVFGFAFAGAFGLTGAVFVQVLVFLLTPKIATKIRRNRSGPTELAGNGHADSVQNEHD
jgi:hypothetical protein